MNYKKNAALILFCLSIYFFSLHTRLIAQPIDKNKNIYIYTLNKAISFDTKLIENFKWLDNYQKYLEYGVIAAGAGAVPANDTFIRLLDLSYYKKNTGLFYYSIPLNSFDEFNRLSEVQSVRNYIEMIETEVSKISNTLKTGNAEVSAFYLGALAKYITNLALWNYALGRNSHIGQAKTEVIIEFFDELDKFISSKNNFKIDRSIEWDGLVEEFDAVNFVVEMIKNSAFDYYNPLRNRDALAMYNQTLMSDALNKSITADKTLKTLSGEYVSYQDWKDDYIKRISETLNLATNYFYELLLKLPALDTRPAVEIAKLSYEANDRRVRLFWDLNINRRVERQLIYRFNSNRKVWEYLSAAPGGTQSYIVDNLENGKQYIFKVTVQEYLRPESVGKQITAVPIDNVPPAKPPKLIVQPLNKAVSLKLSAKQTDYDLANYLLYVYDDSEQLIRNIELPKDFGTFIIDNLKNKRKYKIALSAVDKALNESQESSVSYAEPMDTQPPLSIINLQAQGVNNKITITWDQPKNQFNDIDYQIVRLYDNTNKILREVKLAANVKYYFFDDVFNDYTYKIGIINIDEEDNKSKEINVSVIPVMQGDYYDLQKPDIVINDVNPFVKIYDWNNDKYLDLVAFSNENELLLLENKKNEFIKKATNIKLSNSEQLKKIIICDFNNNNKKDILILADNTITIFAENINNKYEEIKYLKINNNTNIKQIYDVNIDDDKKNDLLILYNSGELAIYRNIGNYNFELVNAEMGIEVIDRFSYIIPFDYNNDGLTDFLAQTNYIMDKNHFILFENNNGKFYKKNILQNVFLDILNWTSADFNFDGRKDLFLSFANAKIGDKILNNILLLNFKDKGFVFSYKNSPFLNTDNPITISEYIDYNADKKKDLITYSIDNIFKIWRNNEKFNFDETAEFTVSGLKYLTQIITADIDNDGDDDIILVLNDNIKIYKNRSNTYIK